jgi:SNF2 family DNA or RNA helicase
VINAEDIKIKKITDKLLSYEGENPYINYLKKKVKSENYLLTPTQVEYIKKNIDKPLITINNVISITSYFGIELQKQFNLKNPPQKILIQTIIGESDKAYHILGKFYKNQEEVKLFWLPKTQLIDDLFTNHDDVTVDFEKYEKIDKLGRKYFNHQKEGVKYLLDKKKCILALDMGLGKTLVSVIAALESGMKRILVVCPSSLKINWQREIEMFTEPEDVSIIRGTNWESAKFTIINYDILKNFHTILEKDKEINPKKISRELVKEKFDVIILDESHYIKNSKSNRGKIIQEIIKESNPKYVWLLTGTPISNRPFDFFNLLNIIKTPVASDWSYYVRRYCGGKQIKTKIKGVLRSIWLTDGSSNLEELHERTKNTILRKKKEDVLDLPEKLIVPLYLELENRSEYDDVFEQYLEWRRQKGKSGTVVKHLVELVLLRKFIALEKVKYSIELAEKAIESGKKVLIFTNFREELEKFKEHFGKLGVYLDGSTKEKDRQKAVDKFQNEDKTKVFVGQIKAAGVGLTLTKAEIVIMNSLDWVPGNLEQAEDRCIFGGQLVMTSEGYKLIEDVEIGDLVYTHLGNFKPVVDKHTHLERKKLRIDIETFNNDEILSVTEDHKIYVYDSETKLFDWIEANKLDINKHHLTLNSKNKTNKENDYITYPIKNLHISKTKRGQERVYDLSVEDDHSFVVGNYNVHNCYRIGQEENVTVYYPLFENTVDTLVWKVLQSKKSVINTIIGDIDDEKIIEDIVENL